MTRYRYKVFADRHRQRREEILRDVGTDVETESVEFKGEDHHVHLLVNFPPKVTVSKSVNPLKGVSSRRLRQEFPDPVRHYHRTNRLWSGSSFAGSVDALAHLAVARLHIDP